MKDGKIGRIIKERAILKPAVMKISRMNFIYAAYYRNCKNWHIELQICRMMNLGYKRPMGMEERYDRWRGWIQMEYHRFL